MNSTIKIIKRSSLGKLKSVPVSQVDKTEQQLERETASTVKGWVAEWHERKRSLQISTYVFVHALDQPPQASVSAVTVN